MFLLSSYPGTGTGSVGVVRKSNPPLCHSLQSSDSTVLTPGPLDSQPLHPAVRTKPQPCQTATTAHSAAPVPPYTCWAITPSRGNKWHFSGQHNKCFSHVHCSVWKSGTGDSGMMPTTALDSRLCLFSFFKAFVLPTTAMVY